MCRQYFAPHYLCSRSPSTTIFAFLNQRPNGKEIGTKTKVNDGSCSFDNILVEAMQHYKIDWLLSSAPTYENISLSVHLLQYSLSSGIGHFLHDQVERHNYVQFFHDYTSVEELHISRQQSYILQIATLGCTHLYAFGWAPKLMQPPFFYVGAQSPCLLFSNFTTHLSCHFRATMQHHVDASCFMSCRAVSSRVIFVPGLWRRVVLIFDTPISWVFLCITFIVKSFCFSRTWSRNYHWYFFSSFSTSIIMFFFGIIRC